MPDDPAYLTHLPSLAGNLVAAPALMVPPLPEMVPSARELEVAEELVLLVGLLLAAVELAGAALVEEVFESAVAELGADESTPPEGVTTPVELAAEATAGADGLALDIVGELMAGAEDITDVLVVVEGALDAAGVELPQADRARTQARRRAEVDLAVLFIHRTLAGDSAVRRQNANCPVPDDSALVARPVADPIRGTVPDGSGACGSPLRPVWVRC